MCGEKCEVKRLEEENLRKATGLRDKLLHRNPHRIATL
jgi:hypothetical protein